MVGYIVNTIFIYSFELHFLFLCYFLFIFFHLFCISLIHGICSLVLNMQLYMALYKTSVNGSGIILYYQCVLMCSKALYIHTGLCITLIIGLKLICVYLMTYMYLAPCMNMKYVLSTNNTNKGLELQLGKNDINVSMCYFEMIILIMQLTQCLILLYYIESKIPANYRNEINHICKYKRGNTSTCMSNRNLMRLFPTAFQLGYTIKTLTDYFRKAGKTQSQRITAPHLLSLCWLYIASYYLILLKPP